jgi:putative ABC transport system permease protein
VLMQLSKDFLKPVVLAFVLSAPLAFLAMQRMLTEFDYRIELQWWMFVAAALLVVLIAAVTVSYQSLKAALVNPVQSLRNE